MPTATLTSKGQITLPAEMRKKLRLKAGDKIDFFADADGSYRLLPKRGSIMDLKGILVKMGYAGKGTAPTLEEMDQAIADHVVEMDIASMSEEGRAKLGEAKRNRG